MRTIVVKVLDKDGSVKREDKYSAEDLGIIGDDWNDRDVDSALDLLQESMPGYFALPDGRMGKYYFEIVED